MIKTHVLYIYKISILHLRHMCRAPSDLLSQAFARATKLWALQNCALPYPTGFRKIRKALALLAFKGSRSGPLVEGPD